MTDVHSGERAGAISGLVAAIAFLLSFVVNGSSLVPSSSADDVSALFKKHLVANQWSALLLLVFALSFMVFSVYLWNRLQAPGLTALAQAMLVLMFGLLTVAATVVQVATLIALTATPSLQGDVGLAGLNDLSQVLFLAIILGFIGFLGAFALVGLTSKVLPVALSWAAAIVALVMAVFEVWAVFNVTSRNLGNYGAFMFLAFVLWLIATSIVLMMRTRRRPLADTTPAAPAMS